MLIEFHYGRQFVKALSDDIRVEIIRHLSISEQTMDNLELIFPISKDMILQHLSVLSDVKLIKTRIVQSLVFYYINPELNNLIHSFLINKHNENKPRTALYHRNHVCELCKEF